MANTPIPMSKLKHLLKLHHLGRSKLEISTITGVSRNTIKKYLAVLSELDLTWEELSAKTDHELDVLFCQEPPSAPDKRLVALHAFFETHDKRLRQRGMTLTRLYEIYRRDTADYFGKTAYYKHYRIWKQRTRPSMRIEHKAGDKGLRRLCRRTAGVHRPNLWRGLPRRGLRCDSGREPADLR